jgi:hypothetical protein
VITKSAHLCTISYVFLRCHKHCSVQESSFSSLRSYYRPLAITLAACRQTQHCRASSERCLQIGGRLSRHIRHRWAACSPALERPKLCGQDGWSGGHVSRPRLHAQPQPAISHPPLQQQHAAASPAMGEGPVPFCCKHCCTGALHCTVHLARLNNPCHRLQTPLSMTRPRHAAPCRMQQAIVAKAAAAPSAAPQAEATLRNQRGSPHKVPMQRRCRRIGHTSLMSSPGAAASSVQSKLTASRTLRVQRPLGVYQGL